MAFQKPKFLYDNRLSDAAPVASSTAAGFDVLNLRDFRPYTWWRPTALPATVTVDCGVPRKADFALLWGHSLHDALVYAEVRGSTDNFSSSDVLLAGSNLLPYPEAFDNAAWPKTASSISANIASAPDGSFTADKLIEDTSVSAQHFCTEQVTLKANTYYSISVHAKAGERSRIQLQTANVGNWAPAKTSIFNLSAGTVDSGDGTIEALGNGWYRCSLVALFGSSDATGGMHVLLDNGSTGNYTGDGVSGVYLWGAQLRASGAAGVVGYYEGKTNRPILLQFTSAEYRYWRLRFVNSDGSAVPTIAIAAIGEALEVPEYLPGGFDPLGREAQGDFNRTAKGHPLGRVIEFEEWRAGVTFSNLAWSWVRASFVPAWQAHLRASPFVFAWDAGDHPQEIYLVNSAGEFKAPHRAGSLADLSLDLVGVLP